jgi:predicted small lipoprotein YifL
MIFKTSVFVGIALSLAACGQMGPLYLPKKPTPAPVKKVVKLAPQSQVGAGKATS